MEAHVTHYVQEEGGVWQEWPFRQGIKPSNPELLTRELDHRPMIWVSRRDGVAIKFVALRLSDGAEWDVVSGFRKPEWNKAH